MAVEAIRGVGTELELGRAARKERMQPAKETDGETEPVKLQKETIMPNCVEGPTQVKEASQGVMLAAKSSAYVRL